MLSTNAAAAPGKFIFDELLGRALSTNLANLFENVCASMVASIAKENFAKIQDFMVRFLFDPGFQELNIRVVEDANRVTVRHDCVNSQQTYPLVQKAGDIDILAQFFPFRIDTTNTKSTLVNALDVYFTMCGMPTIALMVEKLRRVITLFAKHESMPNGQAFLRALRETFPQTHAFAANIVDMPTVQLDATDAGCGCKLVVLQGEVNSAKLEKHYPSLANLLKHMAEMDISMCEHGPFGEKDIHTAAPCMLQMKISYLRGGAIELKVTLMLGPDNTLAWFSRKQQGLFTPGQFRAVDFKENECESVTKFLVSIDGAFRIPQLGCAGSIALPLIICELACINSKQRFPTTEEGVEKLACATRFDISILFMSERRVTALVLRPFFNLDLLRFILLNHFHIQFEVAPLEPHPTAVSQPLKDGIFNSDTEFFDARSSFQQSGAVQELKMERRYSQPKVQFPALQLLPWTISAKIHMFLPIPPKVITSCLSLFVGEQIASPDNIVMLIDLTSAMSKDLKEMSARLARAQGDLESAAGLERELREEQEVAEKRLSRAKESEQRKQAAKKRWWWSPWRNIKTWW